MIKLLRFYLLCLTFKELSILGDPTLLASSSKLGLLLGSHEALANRSNNSYSFEDPLPDGDGVVDYSFKVPNISRDVA